MELCDANGITGREMDRKKVKLMTRMALYEQGSGQKDIQISEYYKKDYASLHMWVAMIWFTIGYLMLVGLLFFAFSDQLFSHTQLSFYIRLGACVAIVYIILLLVYAIAARSFFNEKHSRARNRVKGYMRDVVRLETFYGKRKGRR